MINPAKQWCYFQRDVLRDQLNMLDGHPPSPFTDFGPCIFVKTDHARATLVDWIKQLDGILGQDDA